MSGAKGLRAGSALAEERFDILTPIVEEFFHVEQDYLEVSISSFITISLMLDDGIFTIN